MVAVCMRVNYTHRHYSYRLAQVQTNVTILPFNGPCERMIQLYWNGNYGCIEMSGPRLVNGTLNG